MHPPILLACPACALSSPVFFAASFFIGGVLVGLLIVGFIVGQGLFAVLLIGPAWPEFAAYFLCQCALVAAPLALLVFGGLQYVFAEVDAADSRRDIPSSTDPPLGSNA